MTKIWGNDIKISAEGFLDETNKKLGVWVLEVFKSCFESKLLARPGP